MNFDEKKYDLEQKILLTKKDYASLDVAFFDAKRSLMEAYKRIESLESGIIEIEKKKALCLEKLGSLEKTIQGV